jgi:hypothetical protein
MRKQIIFSTRKTLTQTLALGFGALALHAPAALAKRIEGSPTAAPFMAKNTPAGWNIYRQASGDLNGDGLPDLAWVIQEQSASKIKDNEFLGSPKLNLNPRVLLIALNQTGTATADDAYRLLGRFDKLLPSEGSEETPCLADPFDLEDTDNFSIKKDVLSFSLNYWLSCGSYETQRNTYKFRMDQSGRMRWIGFDGYSSHRASGETHLVSRNLLMGTQIEEFGNFSKKRPSKVKRSTFKEEQRYLEQLNLLEEPESDE